MRVSTLYLDTCALQWVLVPPADARGRTHALAAENLLEAVRKGQRDLCWSPALETEMIEKLRGKPEHSEKLHWGEVVRTLASIRIAMTPQVERRARELRQELGFRTMDALHLAFAELVGAVFITTDYRLVRRAKRCKARLHALVVTPAEAVQVLRLNG